MILLKRKFNIFITHHKTMFHRVSHCEGLSNNNQMYHIIKVIQNYPTRATEYPIKYRIYSNASILLQENVTAIIETPIFSRKNQS